MGDWIKERDLPTVIKSFEDAQAAVAPIYDIRDIFEDAQFQALDTITTVNDPDLGPLRMQNVLYRLSATPGRIRWTGRKRGADTRTVLEECNAISSEQWEQLITDEVIAEAENNE